ncbi:Pyridoxal phosphate-dependent transferase, major domain protein [Metarhizium album ARSEF 1941]|uniref:Pyridoxal phosphate-dependent transferase, major domain protein n=1 Tax=Metarhizium album (strain ARSEF 1941) TaxID=1081103 RepID=A0A0B2WLI9_METAS|nr:Pyridoxal phosphate-dependent transferase, major domain protein [Metarhizium album ARSEF 1941]KHN94342.1 Pyridoxal phosphate-dependent transferase, major domain protein [Metarhizium album ARSEF 1941]
MSLPKTRLDATFESLLARREHQGRLRRLTYREPGVVDFSSNGYLSLSTNSDIKAAYLSHLQSPSNEFSLGSCGSRLLDGNTPSSENLESLIAGFHGASAGLLFNSGFEANTGLFSCAPQPGDCVVYDELIHASVHDGIKLSRARAIPFAHSCVRPGDVRDSSKRRPLDVVLSDLLNGSDGHELRSGRVNVFVAVEGVYSMDGDVAPLRDIVECVEKRLSQGNGHVIVDEAHSTGCVGDRGRGLVCQLGLEERVWARVHTFGKAMGCAGAIVLCTPTTRSYLINYARSLIYTTAMGHPMLTAIQTVYGYLKSGQADGLLANLFYLVQETHALLLSICQKHNPWPQLFRINTRPPQSPIIPLFSVQSRSLARHCQQRGYMVRSIVAPTVPKGTDRVRLCLHAANTVSEVRGLCKAIEEWLEQRLARDCSPGPDNLQLPSVGDIKRPPLAESSKL